MFVRRARLADVDVC